MKVCVYGLWHLGSVTAACLAKADHDVRGLDPDEATIRDLTAGKPPIMEPGLVELVLAGRKAGRLKFFSDAREAVGGCALVWVTFDTPVDDDDRADTQYVIDRISEIIPLLDDGTVVLVSSQLPVGSCRLLEQIAAQKVPHRRVSFACSPENLRLGKALEVFGNPDRVVVGVRGPEDRKLIQAVLRPITERIEWMSVESAEMTKHALNSFLAVSVTFANEIAALCEKVGADAKEVERGLKSEARIGPGAYLSPGTAFAGGTLARDVAFLNQVGVDAGTPAPLLEAVKPSNDNHRQWPHRKIEEIVGQPNGKTISVWGLAYKPGTNTLRRSSSLELCRWLLERGASVHAHDPAVERLPGKWSGIRLFSSPVEAARGADALVVMTAWPQYREVPMDAVLAGMRAPNVVDPARALTASVSKLFNVRYFAVGTPQRAA